MTSMATMSGGRDDRQRRGEPGVEPEHEPDHREDLQHVEGDREGPRGDGLAEGVDVGGRPGEGPPGGLVVVPALGEAVEPGHDRRADVGDGPGRRGGEPQAVDGLADEPDDDGPEVGQRREAEGRAVLGDDPIIDGEAHEEGLEERDRRGDRSQQQGQEVERPVGEGEPQQPREESDVLHAAASGLACWRAQASR
jgi:hypothetical protein